VRAGNVAAARVELRWFYAEGEGALGLRAADYQPRQSRSEGAESARSYEEVVARWTEVARRLRGLPQGHERVLRLAFTPHRWPGLERWYELAGVAALMVDPDDVVEAGRAIVAMPAVKAEALKVGAGARLRLALGAYLGATSEGPRSDRTPASQHPVLEPARDLTRRWVPRAEERGGWMSPGEVAQGRRYGEPTPGDEEGTP
jgi:hypothetical protein